MYIFVLLRLLLGIRFKARIFSSCLKIIFRPDIALLKVRFCLEIALLAVQISPFFFVFREEGTAASPLSVIRVILFNLRVKGSVWGRLHSKRTFFQFVCHSIKSLFYFCELFLWHIFWPGCVVSEVWRTHLCIFRHFGYIQKVKIINKTRKIEHPRYFQFRKIFCRIFLFHFFVKCKAVFFCFFYSRTTSAQVEMLEWIIARTYISFCSIFGNCDGNF